MIASLHTGDTIITTGNHRDHLPCPYTLGPQYLWYSRDVEEFLQELEITAGVRRVSVGVVGNGSKEDYFIKSRGKFPIESDDLMTFGRRRFSIMDLDIGDFYRIMEERVPRVIRDEIVHIEGGVMKGRKDEYSYDSLTSTIPLPDLLKILGVEHHLEWEGCRVIGGRCWEDWIWSSVHDYFYFPGFEVPFYRMTKFGYPYVLLEFPPWGSLDIPWNFKREVTRPFEYAKIISEEAPDLSKYNIRLLGRWGAWKKKEMIHDVIKEVRSWR